MIAYADIFLMGKVGGDSSFHRKAMKLADQSIKKFRRIKNPTEMETCWPYWMFKNYYEHKMALKRIRSRQRNSM